MDLKKYLNKAAKIAQKSKCDRANCGTVIVKNGEIIGRGYNSPPKDLKNQKRCDKKKDEYHQKVTDKTCCMHAEQRAIMDALKKNPEKIKNSILFFARVDDNGSMKVSGRPYCTICSKMALDSGLKDFVLLHENGPKIYDIEEYNDLSFNYNL